MVFDIIGVILYYRWPICGLYFDKRAPNRRSFPVDATHITFGTGHSGQEDNTAGYEYGRYDALFHFQPPS
jgi:hypothetical protein